MKKFLGILILLSVIGGYFVYGQSGSINVDSGNFQGSVQFGNPASQQAGVRPAQQNTQSAADLGFITNLIQQFQNILATLIPLLSTVAVVWFIYNVIMYFFNAEKVEDQAKNVKAMGYGLLAIFVIVSVWGIVKLMGNVTGIQAGGTSDLPGVLTY